MAEADLYFESAAMILTLITVGKTLEAHSKGKTTDALRSLMQLSPKTARLERNGEEVVVRRRRSFSATFSSSAPATASRWTVSCSPARAP